MKSKIGERIKKQREAFGLTQEMLAEKLNFAAGTISKWECGFQDVGKTSIVALAKFFNVTTDYLIGLTDNPKTATPLESPDCELNENEDTEPTPDAKFRDVCDTMREMLELAIIPLISPEFTACCGQGIPYSNITYYDNDAVSLPLKDLGHTFDDTRAPFAVAASGDSMAAWGICDGSKVAVNPAEDINNMDIILCSYHDHLFFKRIVFSKNGDIELLSADGSRIHVDKEDRIPGVFQICGKAMAVISKIRHGI